MQRPSLISLQKSANPTAINLTSIDPGLKFVKKREASSKESNKPGEVL